MNTKVKEQQARIDAQVTSWMAELRRESSRLAGQIAAATGKQYAVVLMSGTDAIMLT
jgi:predicted nucleic acid-binding Zn ribbon protein